MLASEEKSLWLSRKVGDFVAEDFRNAHIFSRFGIDFCCGGGKSLMLACERANAAPEQVLEALQQQAGKGTKEDQLAQLTIPELISHIEAKHHGYIRETAPLLLEYTSKMVRAHGDKYSEIKPFAGWVRALVEDLLPHLEKEENILFPAIRAKHQGQQLQHCFAHISQPIAVMEQEHEDAGQILAKLRELTQNYHAPEHACTTWRVCYDTMAEFEQDLFKHIHLENNILFPQAQLL